MEENKEQKGIINYRDGYLSLPFQSDEFKDFIVSLLGRPQELTKTISGNFDFEKSNLIAICQVLNQRIFQQNNGKLIQFKTTIYYHDDSDVTLGTLEELMTYEESRALVAVAANLSLSYLVQFFDKNHPEKQEINISVVAPIVPNSIDIDKINDSFLKHLFSKQESGFFTISIRYTARTFGEDMLQILSNEINKYIRQKNKFIYSIFKYRTTIGTIIGFLTFMGFMYGFDFSDSKTHNIKMQELKTLFDQNQGNLEYKVEYLISYLKDRHYSPGEMQFFFHFWFPMIISYLIGTFIISLGNNQLPSFLLFSKESIKYRESVIKNYNNQWKWFFVVAILIPVLTNLISSVLYDYLK